MQAPQAHPHWSTPKRDQQPTLFSSTTTKPLVALNTAFEKLLCFTEALTLQRHANKKYKHERPTPLSDRLRCLIFRKVKLHIYLLSLNVKYINKRKYHSFFRVILEHICFQNPYCPPRLLFKGQHSKTLPTLNNQGSKDLKGHVSVIDRQARKIYDIYGLHM